MSSSDDSDDDDNNNNNNSPPGTPESRSIKKLAMFAVTATFAAFGLFTTIAVFNGLFGGGPFLEGFLSVFGFSIPGVVTGPSRVLFVLGFLLAVSWAVEIQGIDTSVPFWVGIGIVLLVVMKFIMPGWVVDAIQFLGIIELVLGIPMTEVNVRRTAVLGVLFILVYYAVLVRLQGALDITDATGSTTATGVLSLTRQRLKSLIRTYFQLFVILIGAIGTFAALTIGYSGRSVAEIISQLLYDPGWGGYLVTLVAYYVNYLTNLLPFQLTDLQFFAFLLVFLAIAVNERFN